MGCSESKIDDKQTTKQCKRTKAYITQSISAHAAFADAHFAYASALKNTGAALSNYVGGELECHSMHFIFLYNHKLHVYLFSLNC